VLFSNVRVHSFSEIEDSVLLPDVSVGRKVRLRRCVVDKGCVLPDGLVAGLDPATDASRFHVSDGGVTLITPDMLGQPGFHQR
jgi:glucose-1-phosphate adenylyltransferase